MKYKLAVFDMDGTILDTLEDLKNSLNYALERFGYPARTLAEVRGFVGNGIRKLVERGVPADASTESTDRVFAEFSAHYALHCAENTRPYSGVTEVLRALRERGIKTAVVSNKADFAVRELCVQYFDGLFDAAVGEKAGVRKKPAPDSVNTVLAELGFDRRDCVYIGDSEVDLQTAQNSGMDCIAVSWGFREVDFLKNNGAKRIISEPSELLDEIL